AAVSGIRGRPGLRTTSLEVRALYGDLVISECEEVAAIDLDSFAVGGRAPQDPLRDTAVARHEMSHGVEPDVRDRRENPREGLAHARASLIACPAHVRARRALKDAIVRHEGHQDIDVVMVPAFIEEHVQIPDRHHSLLAVLPRVVNRTERRSLTA